MRLEGRLDKVLANERLPRKCSVQEEWYNELSESFQSTTSTIFQNHEVADHAKQPKKKMTPLLRQPSRCPMFRWMSCIVQQCLRYIAAPFTGG